MSLIEGSLLSARDWPAFAKWRKRWYCQILAAVDAHLQHAMLSAGGWEEAMLIAHVYEADTVIAADG